MWRELANRRKRKKLDGVWGVLGLWWEMDYSGGLATSLGSRRGRDRSKKELLDLGDGGCDLPRRWKSRRSYC